MQFDCRINVIVYLHDKILMYDVGYIFSETTMYSIIYWLVLMRMKEKVYIY